MKPILVHLHLFYADMWPELKGYLQKVLLYPHEIYITAVEPLPEIAADAQTLSPHVHFEVVENRGYDVGSFVHVLNQVNLADFDYVIKLHSKQNCTLGMLLNSYNVGEHRWRDYLCDFMNHLPQCIEAFAKDSTLGMTANYRLICKKEKYDESAIAESKQMLSKLNLPAKDFGYVAGTMFMCRAESLQPIKNLGLTLADFAVPDRAQKSSLAHTLERMLGWAVKAQGYQIADCFTPAGEQRLAALLTPLRALKNFVYRKKRTKKGKIEIKICKIPVPVIGNEQKSYDLIFSLGAACSCTQALRKAQLQFASYPFDWLFGSDLDGRVDILGKRFDRFLNVDDLSYVFSERSISCDAYHDTYNDLTFNHDFAMGQELTATFPAVKEKYDRRIQRLLNCIKQSEKVLAVFIETPDSGKSIYSSSDLMCIRNRLNVFFPTTQIDLLYVSPNMAMKHGDSRIITNKNGVVAIEAEYGTTKPNEPVYSPDMNVLLKILKCYKLKQSILFRLKRLVLKFCISVVPLKSVRRKMKQKYKL